MAAGKADAGTQKYTVRILTGGDGTAPGYIEQNTRCL